MLRFSEATLSVVAGLDVEAPFTQLRAIRLRAPLESGQLGRLDIDKACSKH